MAEQHHLAILTRGRGSLEITDDIAALVRDSEHRHGLGQYLRAPYQLRAGDYRKC